MAYYDCECDSFDMTEGQDSFEMNEGIPGPGVPAGGSAGQVLRKTTSADYDTEWDTLDAGEIPYSGSTSYPNNTVGSKVYELDSGVNSLWNYAVQANTKASNALDNEATAYNYHLQYHVGDYCLYQQKLYRCIVETPAAGEMWNSSHWTAVTVGDELSETASDISVLRNTLNHKADVIYDTAAGDIASFPDGADGLPVKDLTVAIEPVQDLHGYDYPWPAGGGKNLIDQSLTYQDGNNTTTFGQSVNNTDPKIFLKAGTYTLHVVTNKACSIYYRKGAGGGNTHLINAGTDLVGTFTLDSDTYCAFWCYISNGFTASNIISVQLELGSTATAYEPYSNICPISGWTGCNVIRTNSNLIDKSLCEVGNFNGTTGLPIDATNRIRFNGIIVKPGKYTLSAESPWQVMPIIYELDGTFIGSVEGGNLGWYTSPFTFTLNKPYILKSVFRKGSTNPDVTLSDLQSPALNFGDTALSYEPGSTTDVTINFGETVYGATLDVTTGVLTVTHGYVDLGTLSWEIVGASGSYAYYKSSVVNTVAKISDNDAIFGLVCSAYQEGSSNDVYYHRKVCITIRTTTQRFWIWDDRGLTAEQLETGLSGVTCVYPLLNSVEYQLDPVTVTTLLGQNNVWADCGPSTVEYQADTKLYIQKINTPTDDDMIADTNIASGKYFIVNNNLYLSTAVILAGDPIKPGTNCTLTNLAAALNAINS